MRTREKENIISSNSMSSSTQVKVAVRIRPLSRREEEMGGVSVICGKDAAKVVVDARKSHNPLVASSGGLRSFSFDYCFDSQGPNARQEDVFDSLGSELIRNAWDGYNCSLFAYGVTGAGKSYSMIGTQDSRGLIPRIYSSLFDSVLAEQAGSPARGQAKYSIEVSFSEIYNERVKDLLNPAMGSALRVREHPVTGPYVENLSRVTVSDLDALDDVLAQGFALRATAATNINAGSSRSHAIFTMVFTQTLFDPATNTLSDKVSKIHLVDLAGSERVALSGAQGQQLKEAGTINKSLFYLSKVITELSDGAKHISYRESVLTWLLKESLGGNAKTIMLANISPSDTVLDETMSTLRYAVRAASIVNEAVVNEDPTVALINSLRTEVERLRAQLAKNGGAAAPTGPAGAGPAPPSSPGFTLHSAPELRLGYASPAGSGGYNDDWSGDAVAELAGFGKPSSSSSSTTLASSTHDFEEMRAWTQSIQRHCDDSRNLILSLMMAPGTPGPPGVVPPSSALSEPEVVFNKGGGKDLGDGGDGSNSGWEAQVLAETAAQVQGVGGAAAISAAGQWSDLEIVRVYQRAPFFRNTSGTLAMDAVALFYLASSGVTQVGSELSDEDPGSVRIVGPGILPKHATFVAQTSLGSRPEVTLWTLPLATTSVNGRVVEDGVALKHGDVVQFGVSVSFTFHDAPMFRSSAQVDELLAHSPQQSLLASSASTHVSDRGTRKQGEKKREKKRVTIVDPSDEVLTKTPKRGGGGASGRNGRGAGAAGGTSTTAAAGAAATPHTKVPGAKKVKLRIGMEDLGKTRSVTVTDTTTVEEVCKRAAKASGHAEPGALFVSERGQDARLILPHESLWDFCCESAKVTYRTETPVQIHLPEENVVVVDLDVHGTVADLAALVASATGEATSDFKIFLFMCGRLASLLESDQPVALLSATTLEHPNDEARIVLKRKKRRNAAARPPRPR